MAHLQRSGAPTLATACDGAGGAAANLWTKDRGCGNQLAAAAPGAGLGFDGFAESEEDDEDDDEDESEDEEPDEPDEPDSDEDEDEEDDDAAVEEDDDDFARLSVL
jgi:hypothetical protein